MGQSSHVFCTSLAFREIDTKEKKKKRRGSDRGRLAHKFKLCSIYFSFMGKRFLKYQSSIQFCSANPKNERKKKL